ncbi:hypothetical protein BKA81DRAFT_436912 [Phyllosticta paracitricarpa]
MSSFSTKSIKNFERLYDRITFHEKEFREEKRLLQQEKQRLERAQSIIDDLTKRVHAARTNRDAARLRHERAIDRAKQAFSQLPEQLKRTSRMSSEELRE